MADGSGGQDRRIVEMRVNAEKARTMLEKNINRRQRRGNVRRLVADMVAGRWMMVGIAVMLGVDGRLINGQHTLTALIEASEILAKRGTDDFSVVMRVEFGVPLEVMGVIDTNEKRTLGDGLTVFEGIDGGVSRDVAAVLRAIHKADGGQRDGAKVSLEMARPTFVRFKDDILWAVAELDGQGRASVATFVAAVAYAHSTHPSQVEEAVRALKDPGVPLVGPLRVLKEFLDSGKAGRGGTTSRDLDFLMFLGALQKVVTGGASTRLQRHKKNEPVMYGIDFFKRARVKMGKD